MNAKAYPEGAMTPQNARELREQQQAVEYERRRKSDEAREQGLAQARRTRAVQDKKDAEREELLTPWLAEFDRLQGTLAAAKGVPILRELREAEVAVELAQAAVDAHAQVKP
jgi:hypothetical protein